MQKLFDVLKSMTTLMCKAIRLIRLHIYTASRFMTATYTKLYHWYLRDVIYLFSFEVSLHPPSVFLCAQVPITNSRKHRFPRSHSHISLKVYASKCAGYEIVIDFRLPGYPRRLLDRRIASGSTCSSHPYQAQTTLARYAIAVQVSSQACLVAAIECFGNEIVEMNRSLRLVLHSRRHS